MARSSQGYWAIAIGMIAWSLLLFSPLAFVSSVNAQETEHDYGTVIGIVSPVQTRHCQQRLYSGYTSRFADLVVLLLLTIFSSARIWELHTLASV
jgi:hypothetical protein